MEVRCDEGVAIRHGPEPCVFAFPEAVRRIVHTTNAIEVLERQAAPAVRTRGHFPTDEAATKPLYLVLRRTAGEWKVRAARMVRGQELIRHHVRGAFRQSMMANRPDTQDS